MIIGVARENHQSSFDCVYVMGVRDDSGNDGEMIVTTHDEFCVMTVSDFTFDCI